MRFILLPIVLFSVAGIARSADAPRPLQPADFYRLASVSDPQLSADGSRVVFVVGTLDAAADEPRSSLWSVSWSGAEEMELTLPAKGVRMPRFSPDGRFIAYLAADPRSARDRLLILDRRGGAPRVLSDAEDISDFAWSPDSKRIVAVMQGRESAAAGPPRPIVIDSLYFKQDEDGYLAKDRHRSLYLIEVDAGTAQPLTGEPAGNDSSPAWSPDGGRIAFVRTRELGPDPDGMEDLLVMPARQGAASNRLMRIFAPNRQRLAFSSDGAALEYLSGEEPKFNQYIQDRLGWIAADGGGAHDLSGTLDRDITSFAPVPGSRAVAATIADDGTAYAVRFDLAGAGHERLGRGAHVLSSIATGSDHTVVLYSDDRSPPEVYALEHGELRKLSARNDAFLAGILLGRVTDSSFTSRDGTQIHGLVIDPPDALAGRPYPTLLWLHGGPNGQDAHELRISSDPLLRQLAAAHGYRVLSVNYRGSNGRGRSFQQAIAQDWGHLEIEDIHAALDHAAAAGLVDPKRIAIGGWSYGAILTDFAICADRRFAAAISGAGSANVTSMYGHDEYIIQYNDELGVPWRNAGRWVKLSSPFLHADRIRTPTLFMGGDRDFDVPLVGGEQMYQALRTLGVPATLIVYPGEFHSIRRPSFVVDRASRILDWLDRYLGR